jgi:hypothetical protein
VRCSDGQGDVHDLRLDAGAPDTRDAEALTAVPAGNRSRWWRDLGQALRGPRPYALRRRMRLDMNQNDDGRLSEGETPRSQVSRLSDSLGEIAGDRAEL